MHIYNSLECYFFQESLSIVTMLQNILSLQNYCSLRAFIYLPNVLSVFLGDREGPWKSIFSISTIYLYQVIQLLCAFCYIFCHLKSCLDQLKLFLLFSYLDWISEIAHDKEGNEQENSDKVVLLQTNGHHSWKSSSPRLR